MLSLPSLHRLQEEKGCSHVWLMGLDHKEAALVIKESLADGIISPPTTMPSTTTQLQVSGSGQGRTVGSSEGQQAQLLALTIPTVANSHEDSFAKENQADVQARLLKSRQDVAMGDLPCYVTV